MDFPNFNTPPTYFQVVKMYSLNFFKLTSHFATVKADSPNFYKLPTHFAVVKTNPLYALRQSKRILQTSISLLQALR